MPLASFLASSFAQKCIKNIPGCEARQNGPELSTPGRDLDCSAILLDDEIAADL
jgi:hypothetical protein